jgi:diguanylate cyclase (GGDEF)-like protein
MLSLGAVLVDWTARSAGADPDPLAHLLASGWAALSAVLLLLALGDRARRDRVRARPLRLVQVAVFLLFGTMSIGYLLTSTAGGPFDSRIEAVAVLVSIPFAAVGLIWLCWPTAMPRSEIRTTAIDALIAVLGLAVVWWQVVVPAWPVDERIPGWVTLNQVLVFGSLALGAVLAVASRRISALPFPQLALLVGGILVFFVADAAGQLLPGLDDVTSVTYSLLAYPIAVAMIAAFAHRPAVEAEPGWGRTSRELLSTLTPTVVALPAGLLIVQDAMDELVPAARVAAVVFWTVLVLGVFVARYDAVRALRRISEENVGLLLADRTREGWFTALVGDQTEAVLVVDVDGAVAYRSPRLDSLLAAPGPELRLHELAEDLDEGRVRLLLAGVALDPDGAGGPYDVRWRGADGTPVESETRIRPLRDVEFEGFVVTIRDVSDTRRLVRQLAASERRDSLTGVLSRGAFLAEVAEVLESRGESAGAVLTLDLDRFGALNDVLGHDVGDATLVAVAEAFTRLPTCVRAIARIGGDSFALLLECEDLDRSLGTVLSTARQDLQGLVLPDGRELEVGFRAGFVAIDRVADRSPEWHLEAADLALARARRSRHATVVEYDARMREESERRLTAEARIRAALADGRIEVHYQPIVRLSDLSIVGAEALARLRETDGSLRPPVEFIPLAEELGLIGDIGLAVLEQATRDTAALRQDLGRDLRVSVNVATDQVGARLGEEVAAALGRSGLPHSLLTLEITESGLVDGSDATTEVLRSLRGRGVAVFLDDFGTGYSSLSYLASLPVGGLKIDRSFISVMGSSDSVLDLARIVVQLADTLGLDVVAEGVETVEQADLLRGMGCAYAQGFLFSRPVPLADYRALVEGPFARDTVG